MLNLITIIVGVAIGSSLATLITASVLYNEKVLEWICRKSLKLSKKLAEELEDEF